MPIKVMQQPGIVNGESVFSLGVIIKSVWLGQSQHPGSALKLKSGQALEAGQAQCRTQDYWTQWTQDRHKVLIKPALKAGIVSFCQFAINRVKSGLSVLPLITLSWRS